MDAPNIQRVAVIGAGVMGAGIAAHIANAGIPVLLLDIVPKDAADRNVVAKGALEKLKKGNPAAFMLPGNAALVTPGNIDDDLDKLAEVDGGRRAGIPTEMAEKVKALERENRELRQANEILRKASAYFAMAELDRRSK